VPVPELPVSEKTSRRRLPRFPRRVLSPPSTTRRLLPELVEILSRKVLSRVAAAATPTPTRVFFFRGRSVRIVVELEEQAERKRQLRRRSSSSVDADAPAALARLGTPLLGRGPP
jgi:methyl coenzyme M reductase subunit D